MLDCPTACKWACGQVVNEARGLAHKAAARSLCLKSDVSRGWLVGRPARQQVGDQACGQSPSSARKAGWANHHRGTPRRRGHLGGAPHGAGRSRPAGHGPEVGRRSAGGRAGGYQRSRRAVAAAADAARANGADLLIIDSAPNADRASLIAAKAADLILIPCRPAKFDLAAIEATRDLATIAKKPAWVVLSAAPVRSAIVAEARLELEAKGSKIAPQIIHQRVAYYYSVIDGRTASEYEPGGKAAEEVAELFRWACEQVGLSAGQRDEGTGTMTKRPSLFSGKADPVAEAPAPEAPQELIQPRAESSAQPGGGGQAATRRRPRARASAP